MRTLLLSALLMGCNTAAKLDIEAEELAEVALVGGHGACEGDGFVGALALINQRGGPVMVGGARIPLLPADATDAIDIFDVTVDGVETRLTIRDIEAVVHDDDLTYSVVLDRSGSACGALPTGPWLSRCNLAPCGTTESVCDLPQGCCGDGQVCAATVLDGDLQQICVPPDDCDCGPDDVCVEGDCVPRLFGPIDPDDLLVQRFAASADRLLSAEDDRLSPKVGGVLGAASSEGGLQLLGSAVVRDFVEIERAVAGHLLPPFGRASLLNNLSKLRDDGPVIAWVLRPGASVSLEGRPMHVLVARDSEILATEDDQRLAAAACETGGIYVRYPTAPAIDLDAFAGRWVPGIARSHLRLSFDLDPKPAPGPHRFEATLRVRVRGLIGEGTRPPQDILEQPIDFILGGHP